MKNKRQLSILLVMIMIFSTFISAGNLSKAAIVAGDGTEAAPYQITTVEELYSISSNPEAHYKLMTDLDLGEVNRLPIGEFKGVLDGNGYTIKNLYINNQNSINMGLFSKLTNAEVKNLTIKDSIITTRAHNVGALAGYVDGSSISNCYTVGGEIFTVGTGAGGLAGNVVNSQLYQCYSTAKIDTVSNFVGGLVGYAGAGVKMTQCFATASVRGMSIVGGLVGFNTTSLVLEDCYAISKVISYGTDSVGTGLSHSNSMHSIKNCYAASTISATNKVGLGMSLSVNSYFNVDRAGIYTPYTEGRTAEAMYTSANYVGWDFVNVWTINEGQSYPQLRFAVDNE